MSGIGDFFGNLFDPTDKSRVAAANAALSSTLAPGSAYWNQGNIGDKDAGILQGAANLQNTHIGANTANVDQDAAAQAALADLYANIAANGGQMTEAVKHQASSDLANTASSKLNVADRTQASNVLAQDSAERNAAAQGANANRAKVLANELQKQVWRTAVNHANFEAALAGKGIQNADYNLTGALALAKAQGAQDAAFGQQSADRAASATNFANTMAGLQAVGGALGQVASTGADMYAADKAATQGVDSSTKADMYSATPSQTTYVGSNGKSGGYALSGITPSSKLLASGQTDAGNVDLTHRSIVYNDDGTYSTVRSMTFKDGDKFVVVPSAYNGAIHSADEAWQHYKETGEHMGKFDSEQAADAYAESVHDDQATQYKPQQSGWDGVMGPMPTVQTNTPTVTPSSKYTNPITGNTVDPNLPTDTSSWGDWLTGTSLVA